MLDYLIHVIKRTKNDMKDFYAKKRWRKINIHNQTVMVNRFDISKVNVGKATYGPLKVLEYTKEEVYLQIGSYCSIAEEVTFLLGVDHDSRFLSTYPFNSKILFPGMREATTKGNIIVEDDVWIGYRSVILSGVHIGKGSIIAAGSVVNRDVPAYSIVGGVPAKVLKYRFDNVVCDKLKMFDYSNLSEDMIKQSQTFLYKEIDRQNINDIITALQ